MRGRGKRLRELSIIQAFDTARIRGDAEAGNPRSLGEYLAELLSDQEQAERSEEQFFAKFDLAIAAGEDTLQ